MPEKLETKEEKKEEEIITDEENDVTFDQLDEKSKKEIIKLRRESAEKRVKNKDLQAQLDALNLKNKQEEEKKMAEDGRLKELLTNKEAEIESLKIEAAEKKLYEQTFTEQLDTILKKLPTSQRELIHESKMSLAEKVKWATRFESEGVQTPGPDSRRPGGEAVEKEIKLTDYVGLEGQKRLIALRDTNPKLYQRILELKNQTD